MSNIQNDELSSVPGRLALINKEITCQNQEKNRAIELVAVKEDAFYISMPSIVINMMCD